MRYGQSRVDAFWAFFYACIHLSVCLYFAPFGFADYLHDGLQLRIALDILEGATLFKDTFTIYGVLPHYMHAAVVSVFGAKLLYVKYYYCVLYFFYFRLMLVFISSLSYHWNGIFCVVALDYGFAALYIWRNYMATS